MITPEHSESFVAGITRHFDMDMVKTARKQIRHTDPFHKGGRPFHAPGPRHSGRLFHSLGTLFRNQRSGFLQRRHPRPVAGESFLDLARDGLREPVPRFQTGLVVARNHDDRNPVFRSDCGINADLPGFASVQPRMLPADGTHGVFADRAEGAAFCVIAQQDQPGASFDVCKTFAGSVAVDQVGARVDHGARHIEPAAVAILHNHFRRPALKTSLHAGVDIACHQDTPLGNQIRAVFRRAHIA